MATSFTNPFSTRPQHRFSPPHSSLLPLQTHKPPQKNPPSLNLTASSKSNNDDYLIDAPVSPGDGFSFTGGKYSGEPSPADDWLNQGRIVRAHPVASAQKAKDPLFGLTLGAGSQASDDLFRWFCLEAGDSNPHTVVLLHGFPSQSYSYRNVIPTLAQKYRVLAFDWLGFGFSDKPQPGYGFNYTLEEYSSSLDSLIESISTVDGKLSIVVQGYFSPLVIKFASRNRHKLRKLVLLNPPVTARHVALPSSLSVFGNFLVGEVFAQDPIRASDKTLTSCGPYQMKEEDAMVYRRPYLTSGSAGFALSAVVRSMSRELKAWVGEAREMMMSDEWEVETAMCWGMRDRWLGFDDVEEFCRLSEVKLVELPEAGHHVQQDCGLELGNILTKLIG